MSVITTLWLSVSSLVSNHAGNPTVWQLVIKKQQELTLLL